MRNPLAIENRFEAEDGGRLWETLSEEEKERLAEALLAAAMEGAGYERKEA